MRKGGLYARLAMQGMQKNGRFYLPYLLTCAGASALFYDMIYLNGSAALATMRGGSTLGLVLSLGVIVIGLFSAVMLFYTNSFIMKRRKKELGLYSILGMEKRHIGRVMLYETLYTTLIGIAVGIALGILLSKLLLLLLCSLMKFDVRFGFEVSIPGIVSTAIVYSVIFFINLTANLVRVNKAQPIELMRAQNTADREPKTRWVLTVIGLITLIAGYIMAVTVEDPVEALAFFFVAVLLVIAGTYCLFTAGSIAVLKLLKKNRAYYYQAKHFTSVSGMLHRMKRNAAGLASICILSTMVLVTVSTTLCLYIGGENAIAVRYPYDISYTLRSAPAETAERAAEVISEQARRQGIEIGRITTSRMLETTVSARDSSVTSILDNSMFKDAGDSAGIAVIMSDGTYSALSGNSVALSSGSTLAQADGAHWSIPDSIDFDGIRFDVTAIDDFPDTEAYSVYAEKLYCFVMCESDMAALNTYLEEYSAESAGIFTRLSFDVPLVEDSQTDFCNSTYDKICDTLSEDGLDYGSFYSQCRAADAEEFYAMYGGFFFLGIFLGLLFLMATAIIIYYKQASEGYEDADRFKIMKQVGMSDAEVRSSIKSQILTVFFLPLAVAGVHVFGAFNMITRLLRLFNLYDTGLFAVCCLGTIAVFGIVYTAIYLMTAKTYYGIVDA